MTRDGGSAVKLRKRRIVDFAPLDRERDRERRAISNRRAGRALAVGCGRLSWIASTHPSQLLHTSVLLDNRERREAPEHSSRAM
jgi:hypothetical protein